MEQILAEVLCSGMAGVSSLLKASPCLEASSSPGAFSLKILVMMLLIAGVAMGLIVEVMSLMEELSTSVFNWCKASPIVLCLHWVVTSSLDKDGPMPASSTDLMVDETTASSGFVVVETGEEGEGDHAGTTTCSIDVDS
jgi:fucose 4-O-acetylase-like acetyltransferase